MILREQFALAVALNVLASKRPHNAGQCFLYALEVNVGAYLEKVYPGDFLSEASAMSAMAQDEANYQVAGGDLPPWREKK